MLIPAGLAIRRLRPVTAAFAILAAMALRPGYLPVPLVIGMLPFASLLVAGVADTVWARPVGAGEAANPAPDTGHRGRPLHAGKVLVIACLAVAAMVVVPQWWQRDRDLMTVDHDRPFRQTEAWIATNVPHTARLLVDDALWVDLVERGHRPGQVRLVLQAATSTATSEAVTRAAGASSTTWSPTPILRSFPDSLPQAREAQRRSKVVATFGHGTQRVEIRKVQGSPV